MSKAFLVGINYKGSIHSLNGCINDANSMRNILIGFYGYDPENILIMTDDTEYKPTREMIFAGWKWLLSGASRSQFLPNNNSIYDPITLDCKTFVFHYSGHGSQLPDDETGEESDGKDETLCPLDFEKSDMIRDDDIKTMLTMKVPSQSRLISIIDACHSSTVFDQNWTYIPHNITNYHFEGHVKINGYPDTDAEIITISGCRDDQTSADIYYNLKSQGALTCALLATLMSRYENISYCDLIYEIFSFIRRKNLSNQVPCISFGKNMDMSKPFTF